MQDLADKPLDLSLNSKIVSMCPSQLKIHTERSSSQQRLFGMPWPNAMSVSQLLVRQQPELRAPQALRKRKQFSE